jgi:hypothetical protein
MNCYYNYNLEYSKDERSPSPAERRRNTLESIGESEKPGFKLQGIRVHPRLQERHRTPEGEQEDL